jgi:formamidopyrimidine-DNA glycosylase
MPELPEVTSRAREMNAFLVGKRISTITVIQPKSLNIPEEAFIAALIGARIEQVFNRGKWIFVRTSQGWLLLNLGMGGEILLVPSDRLPDKRRLIFDFDDGNSLSINFWWFGYAHFAPLDHLASHEMTARIGPNATDLSLTDWQALLLNQRKQIKALLLDQSQVAGIGNAYIHDILFLARLHPLRKADSLTTAEIAALAEAVQAGLQPSLEKGGAFYELNLFGEKGGFRAEDILIGYREGQPCPRCATPIQKIRTGSTSSFICPSCQPLVSPGS